MDWYPSAQMTVDDLKAVLLSWRIKIPAKPNKASNETEKENLRRLVAINHQKIMHDIFGGGGAPASSSGDVAPSIGAASIGAAIDKAVGTDSPLAEFSFIGSRTKMRKLTLNVMCALFSPWAHLIEAKVRQQDKLFKQQE